MNTDALPARSALARFARGVLSEYFILFLTLIFFLTLLPFLPVLGSKSNLLNVFANALPVLALAIGQTIVLIAGGIDLSITSIVAMSSVVGARLLVGDGGATVDDYAMFLAIAAMLVTGCGIGLLNGCAVTLLRMPAFIVTLTSMMFFSGLAVWATAAWSGGSNFIAGLPRSFLSIAGATRWGVPRPLIIVVVLALAAHLMLRHTVYGQWLHAVGANASTARVSGVPVRRMTIVAYVVSGLCAAVAGVLYTTRLEMGSPSHAERVLLDVIGAVVIGGTSLFGGKGKILGTAFGVLFLTLLDNALNLADFRYATIMIVKGLVILGAAGVDLLRVRWLARG